ncbi:MAG: ABC transporter substrate-binding protein [Chitinophagales bacterium]
MVRRVFLAVIAILVLAVVPAFAGDQVLRLGFMPAEDELPLYVAEKEGLFAKEGVKVELVTFASAVERDTAWRAGRVDGVNGDLIATILNAKGGYEPVILCMSLGATAKEGRFAIFAAPGGKVKTAVDLRNVEVAVSRNTIQDYVTDQLLQDAGLKASEIKKVDVPKVPIRFQMLLQGQVQAAALPDPLGALAEHEGARLVASDTEAKRNLSPIVYFFSRKTLKEKSDELARFFRAYREAVNRINANPEKYRPLLIQVAKVPDQIKETYPMQKYPQPLLPTRSEWKEAVDWMLGEKLIDQNYRYEDYADGRFTR